MTNLINSDVVNFLKNYKNINLPLPKEAELMGLVIKVFHHNFTEADKIKAILLNKTYLLESLSLIFANQTVNGKMKRVFNLNFTFSSKSQKLTFVVGFNLVTNYKKFTISDSQHNNLQFVKEEHFLMIKDLIMQLKKILFEIFPLEPKTSSFNPMLKY